MKSGVDLRGAKSRLADFKNPFEKDCVESVMTHCYKGSFDREWKYRGTIKFINGNTNGEQRFSGKSLAEVLQKMETFVEGL